jgi:hypothetical protein
MVVRHGISLPAFLRGLSHPHLIQGHSGISGKKRVACRRYGMPRRNAAFQNKSLRHRKK